MNEPRVIKGKEQKYLDDKEDGPPLHYYECTINGTKFAQGWTVTPDMTKAKRCELEGDARQRINKIIKTGWVVNVEDRRLMCVYCKSHTEEIMPEPCSCGHILIDE